MGYIENNNNKSWLHNDLFAGIFGWKEYLITYNKDQIKNKEDIVLIAIHNPEYISYDDIDFQDDFVISENFIGTLTHHPSNKIEGFHDVIQMNFWDIEVSTDNYKTITKEQGQKLREFILKNKDKQFLIHCSAGISRSAGVACAVECLINYNGDSYAYKTGHSDVKNHPRYAPNWTVYDAIIN